jgi:hypothetical protein
MKSLPCLIPARVCALFALILSLAVQMQGVTRHVYNATDFEALPTLAAGDIVICHNGTYTDVSKTITASGSSGSPVIIYAENVGGVAFAGATSITISGSYVTFAGFKFAGTPSPAAHPRLTNRASCSSRATRVIARSRTACSGTMTRTR